jgi:HEAT repeat protein
MKPIGVTLAIVLALPAFGWQDKESDKLKIKGLKEYGKQGSPAIPKIAPYLEDGSVEVRREAVRALVAAGTQRSLDPLVQACKDNDAEVQIVAVDGLVNFYLPGYVETGMSASLKRAGGVVASRWSDGENTGVVEPDTPIRPEIVAVLNGITTGGSAMESRANAARALGILRAREGVPSLVGALKSKDSRLMFESLVALQKVRDVSAGPRAVFLVRDLDERVQLAAIETVGLLRTMEAVTDLKRVLENPSNKKVRRAALVALGQIADPSNRQMFLGLLGDKDDEARAAAYEGLGRIASPEDRAAMDRAWADEKKAGPRLAAAFALAQMGSLDTGSYGSIGHLVNSLNQKAWRGVAQPYLAELAVKQAPRTAILTALGRAGTPDEKIGVAQALASCACKDAVPALQQLSRDDDAAVAKEALRTLRILR